ncbi:MAG: LicD family protein [Prevotella sp.]|nr:LicD family protein [Prevotella sp.]MBQ9645713.1 LicD family protein [Prevotella sp.]
MNTYNTRDIQQHTLPILLTVDKILREHQLNYYISDGTMLGAVRHGGFIPWDDDVDIAMPRPDYEQLVAHGSEWLPKPLEMVCVEKDARQACTFMKIIDGSTTLIERWSYNQLGGIYIDVFPIDGVSDWKWKRKLRFRLYRILNRMTYLRNRDPYKRGHGCSSWVPRLLQATISNAKLHQWMKSVQTARSFNSAALIADYDSGERSVVKKSVFGKPRPIMFEGHELLGVEHPQEYLTHLYGDYMQLPPEEKRRVHGFDYVDLEHSYHDYHDTRQFK